MRPTTASFVSIRIRARRDRPSPSTWPRAALADGDGELWAAGYEAGQRSKSTSRRDGRRRLPVGEGPSALAAEGGSLWVANSLAGTLSRIDAATGQTRSVIPIGSGPSALAVTTGAVWVANEYSGTVVEIEVETGRARRVVDVGGRPSTLASNGGRVWVGSGPSADLHRGGTLRLSGTVRPNSLDPAFELVGSWEGAQLPRLVYDSLVTFENSPGPDGLRLVPDLAVELPNAAAGGTVYVFHLRPGIRYSTGRLCRRVTFAGSLSASFAQDHRRGATTNRSSAQPRAPGDQPGVTCPEVSSRTIVRALSPFTWPRPTPSFLYKLTLFAFAAPVPPGVPAHDRGYTPVAGTGPYRFAATIPHRASS